MPAPNPYYHDHGYFVLTVLALIASYAAGTITLAQGQQAVLNAIILYNTP